MNINKTVQTEISTRFGGGEIFTTYNFADLEKLLCCKPSSIRNALFYLRADAKFITLKYRAATAQSNKQLVNHYQIAKFDKQDLIHLKFNNQGLQSEFVCTTTCAHCKNKTFLLTRPDTNEETFMTLKCAACGSHIGRIGWVEDDDAP